MSDTTDTPRDSAISAVLDASDALDDIKDELALLSSIFFDRKDFSLNDSAAFGMYLTLDRMRDRIGQVIRTLDTCRRQPTEETQHG